MNRADPPVAKTSRRRVSAVTVDVHLPITDGRQLILSRTSEPNAEQRLLVA